MPLPPRFLEELNSKISLAQVVGKKVKLTKRGREYIGLCPFHHEKTPSFSVSEEKGFYHCFGCGAHGDAIRFVMETERRSFPDVLEQLCRSVGMEPPRSTPEQQAMAKRQMSLYKIMEKACSFYQEQLFKTVGEKALSYLKKRRLEAQTIETFRLGYAPGGNLLRTYLLREGCDEQDLIALGLVCKSTEAGRDNYDYFRDRVIFPIQDRRGHIIGFGGRVMGDG
ncbi:MAG: DNA primase, partial [Alphaproteobacteria bacterium]|nr:DNA primase [Alphaproteobacteria bacterium]